MSEQILKREELCILMASRRLHRSTIDAKPYQHASHGRTLSHVVLVKVWPGSDHVKRRAASDVSEVWT